MKEIIQQKAKKLEENDYVKFKKFLRFFVKQAEINKEKGRAESPTINKKRNAPYENKPEFAEHYGLDPEFNKIAGQSFTIRFCMRGKYGGPKSTYINMGIINIIGKFKDKKITHLKNVIRLDIKHIKYTEEQEELYNKWNETHQEFYSIKELEIDKDNNYPPNNTLRKVLDEYMECYSSQFYNAEKSVKLKKERS
jgi:hypothetical protein